MYPALPGPHVQAYGIMESVARLVLAALCRSSLLRLRSDAFSGMLDDVPMARSVQGSSVLLAKSYVNNFSHLSDGSSFWPLFADPQVRSGCAPVLAGNGGLPIDAMGVPLNTPACGNWRAALVHAWMHGGPCPSLADGCCLPAVWRLCACFPVGPHIHMARQACTLACAICRAAASSHQPT